MEQESGLFGFILVLGAYAVSEILTAILQKQKLNKYVVIGIALSVIAVICLIAVIGSNTIARRKHLKDIQGDIVDQGEESHISGSLLKIKQRIDADDVKEEEMSKPAQQSVIDLYNYAKEHQVINNDMRRQQMIYNIFLIKNQANPILIIFGNGYMANFRELVLEIEMLALITNFGLLGFALYIGPFIWLLIYGIVFGFKNRKKIDSEYMMYLGGLLFSFALSTLSGYTFFNSSSMMMVVVLGTLLINKIKKYKFNND